MYMITVSSAREGGLFRTQLLIAVKVALLFTAYTVFHYAWLEVRPDDPVVQGASEKVHGASIQRINNSDLARMDACGKPSVMKQFQF
jgi:hypothetical protein